MPFLARMTCVFMQPFAHWRSLAKLLNKFLRIFAKKHPQIPWQDIGRMRDKLIHHYFGVNLEVVWRTVQEDILPLQKTIEQMLAEI